VGISVDHIKLNEVGIHGNGHIMFMEEKKDSRGSCGKVAFPEVLFEIGTRVYDHDFSDKFGVYFHL